MKIHRETLASLLFIGIGGVFAIASLQHPMGTAVSMGRGFFPFWVGAILAALGVLMLVRSLAARGGERLAIDLKPVVAITASILAFAILLPFGGLYVATVATVLIAARAERDFGFRAAVALGLGLAVAAHLAFIAGIGLQLPLWPNFDL